MADRIRNRDDWYMVGLLERHDPERRTRTDPRRRGTTWLNHVLVHALSPEDAYRKGMALGRQRVSGLGRLWSGRWSFLGIAEMLPVSGDIADGTELLWLDFGRISAMRARSFVKPRASLLREVREERDSIGRLSVAVARDAKE